MITVERVLTLALTVCFIGLVLVVIVFTSTTAIDYMETQQRQKEEQNFAVRSYIDEDAWLDLPTTKVWVRQNMNDITIYFDGSASGPIDTYEEVDLLEDSGFKTFKFEYGTTMYGDPSVEIMGVS